MEIVGAAIQADDVALLDVFVERDGLPSRSAWIRDVLHRELRRRSDELPEVELEPAES